MWWLLTHTSIIAAVKSVLITELNKIIFLKEWHFLLFVFKVNLYLYHLWQMFAIKHTYLKSNAKWPLRGLVNYLGIPSLEKDNVMCYLYYILAMICKIRLLFQNHAIALISCNSLSPNDSSAKKDAQNTQPCHKRPHCFIHPKGAFKRKTWMNFVLISIR